MTQAPTPAVAAVPTTSVTMVELEPADVVLFRDARPFAPRGRTMARGGAPEPGGVFGAIRTAAIEAVCQRPAAYAQGKRCSTCATEGACPAVLVAGPPGSPGQSDHRGQLRLLGMGMADESQPGCLYVPRPGLLGTLPGDSPRTGLLRPVPLGQRRWNASCPEVPLFGGKSVEGVPPSWLSVEDAMVALSGYLERDDGQPIGAGLPPWAMEEAWRIEPRVGLARSKGVAMEGYLYRVDFQRFYAGVRVAALVKGAIGVSLSDWAHLGGRGRLAHLERRDWSWPPQPRPAPDPGRFVVALVTPAWFRAGWHPPLPMGSALAAAIVGPLVPSKGWDLAHHRPRPMRWCAPASSVWWIQAESQEAAAAIASWHGRPICEDRPAAGYGLALVARQQGDP